MKKIIPNLYTFTGLIAGRVYMIQDPDGLTIIDTGIASAADKIIKQLEKAGHSPTDVKRILITHAHPDHVGGLPKLKEITGAQVITSTIERPILEGKVPIPLPPREQLSGIARLINPPPQTLKGPPVDREVNDGDTIPEVMGGLQVVAAPGHTLGQIAFWQPQKRVLICGDAMANLLKLRLPFAAFTVDMDQARHSIQRLDTLQPRILCFGHGNPLRKNTAQTLANFARHIAAK